MQFRLIIIFFSLILLGACAANKQDRFFHDRANDYQYSSSKNDMQTQQEKQKKFSDYYLIPNSNAKIEGKIVKDPKPPHLKG